MKTDPSFNDLLSQVVPTFSGGKPCSVATAKDRMTPASQEQLDYWLFDEDRTYTNVALAETIEQLVHVRVSRSAMTEHRLKRCRCFRYPQHVGEKTK